VIPIAKEKMSCERAMHSRRMHIDMRKTPETQVFTAALQQPWRDTDARLINRTGQAHPDRAKTTRQDEHAGLG
jgi:hypothetical protein